ncbi:hypothetical protein HZS_7668 [Henneguya salminicola]|nr:hypothetical protein HZS_7668 [Henneguya salminicola]
MDFKAKPSNRKHQKVKTKKHSGNAKAFTYTSGKRAARAQTRALDIATKKHHIPQEIHNKENNPPIVVAIVGPPRVGKSTLVSTLIKRYNRQQISKIQGPITIVTGKNQRVTLIECNNDINCMIDLAKIADLVLLLVDATFGFEMEIFEFLNILHAHGFPKVIGVLTHLDLIQCNKSLTKYKKKLKKRFWEEVYDGAKLFYLSEFRHNLYGMKEILNLSRFISVSKCISPAWRTSHPYVLADRFEDITEQEKIRKSPEINRTIAFYGYVHGTHIRETSKIHISGCGDFSIKNISYLSDPCDLPLRGKKRALDENERVLYAPFSGVGNVIYDQDAVYINVAGCQTAQNSETKENEITEKTVCLSSIKDLKYTIDTKLSNVPIQLFQDGPLLYENELKTDKFEFYENIQNDEENPSNTLVNSIKNNLNLNNDEFLNSHAPHIALYRSIYKPKEYLENVNGIENFDEDCIKKETYNSLIDSTVFSESLFDWNCEEKIDQLRSLFLTRKTEASIEEDICEDSQPLEKESANEPELDCHLKLKKSKIDIINMRQQDEKYLNQLKKDMEEKIVRTEQEYSRMPDEERVILQGYRPGMYVRIEIEDLPSAFVTNFDPTYPILIGGLLPGEEDMGFIKLRVKKHRFHKKILKTRDPIILSCGWRRFQTILLYAMEDHNMRMRYIKYTPKFLHCMAVCYGPIVQPGFGIVGIQKIAADKDIGFRISITGVTLENDKTCKIVKKLKLIGYPYKVHKNTAFIEKMFTSALEVAKFEGGIIQTVSGIRGHIKKAVSEQEGAFRAKFEDKILLSDIVSLRTWGLVECPTLYNLVTNLLMPVAERSMWSGMRTVYELRKQFDISNELKVDSQYKEIHRDPVKFAPLRIPQKLMKRLPFSAKPKNILKAKPKENRPKILTDTDKKSISLLNEIALIQKDISISRTKKRKQEAQTNREKLAKMEEEQNKKRKINQKKVFKKLANFKKTKKDR